MPDSPNHIKSVSLLLSDLAITLIMNGANTSRTLKNTLRISNELGFKTDFFFSLSSVILTVSDIKGKESHTIVRSIPHISVNFEIISEISLLSWRVVDENLNVYDIEKSLREIKRIKQYSKIYICIFVGLAGAGLCRILGGSWWEFIFCFFATVIGLLTRILLTKKGFNIFIVFSASSFAAVSTISTFRLIFHDSLNSALASCVLFLIPGVPLINSFIDILEGYISQGIARGILGTMLILSIAIGLFLSLFIFGYGFN